jgi:DNA-binding LytR/AlgR family response regulator
MSKLRHTTMCIVHKGLRGFRALSPALILGGKLIGLKPAIPNDFIPPNVTKHFEEKQTNIPIAMKIEIKNNKATHYIDINQIVFCEADRMYSSIYILNSKSIVCSRPLKLLETILPADKFCRIHKSYILNINFLTQVIRKNNREYAIVNESTEIPISKNKKSVLKKMLMQKDGSIYSGR